jgi:chromate transporter
MSHARAETETVRQKSDATKPVPSATPTLPTLGWLVCYDVNRTLGGIASMELLRRSLGARGWMTDERHALFVAISRLTPGTNILAYCVALGWQLAHWRGALVSLAAASIPASILIAVLSASLTRIDQLPIVRAVIAIALIVATLLVLATAWNLLRPYVKGGNAIRTGIIAAIVIVLALMNVTPVRILLVAAVLGVVMTSPPAPVAEVDS